MKKGCLNCGKDLAGLALNAGAKFCEPKCKNQYHNKKKAKKEGKNGTKKTDPSLSGVTFNQPLYVEPEIAQSQTSEDRDLPKAENSMPPSLRNAIWINTENKEADSLDNEEVEEITYTKPVQYLEKTSLTPNPEFDKCLSQFLTERHTREKILNKIQIFQTALKSLENNKGIDLAKVGAGAGVIYGFMSNDKDATFLERLGKVLGYGLLGYGAGKLGKLAAEKFLKADRKQKILLINKDLDSLQSELMVIDSFIKDAELALKKTSALLNKNERILNPAYEQFIKKQKEKEDLSGNGLNEDLNAGDNFVPQSNKIYTAKEFGSKPMQVLEFNGPWKELFDRPSINFHCLVHGNPGEGKSTFCLWFARYLAENFGRVVYVSGEEGQNSTFQNKVKYCEADVEGLYISDIHTGQEFLEEVYPHEFNFVIFDSLHDMGINAEMMKQIKEKYPNTAFIAIEQNNKKGEILGRNDMKHTFDIVVNVVNYTAETTKNRFKQKGVSLSTAEFGEHFEKGGNGLRVIKFNKSDQGKDYPEDPEVKKIV